MCMWKCSASHVIREPQMKTTVRSHDTSIKMAEFQNTVTTNHWQGRGATGTLQEHRRARAHTHTTKLKNKIKQNKMHSPILHSNSGDSRGLQLWEINALDKQLRFYLLFPRVDVLKSFTVYTIILITSPIKTEVRRFGWYLCLNEQLIRQLISLIRHFTSSST